MNQTKILRLNSSLTTPRSNITEKVFTGGLRTSHVRINYLGKWKFSTPLKILQAVRHSGGRHKNALFKGCSTLVAMVTTTACSRPGASFSYKNVAKKRVKCLFLYLKLNTTLQIGTSTIHSNIIRLHFNTFNFPWE